MKRLICLLALLFTLQAQAQNITLAGALQLKEAKKWKEAFDAFSVLLKSDSTNVDYLTNASYLYSKLGNLKTAEAERQAFFNKALYLAKKARSINPSSAHAHYMIALALGRINEHASNKQKIANAKLIKNECDTAVKLDPKLAGAYHILGRWHRTVAGFNFIEKAMINTLFGGVPEGGSYEAAIDNFSKAILLEPDEMLHKFELAETYRERNNDGDDIKANVWYKKVLEMKAKDEDERGMQEKAMKKVNSN